MNSQSPLVQLNKQMVIVDECTLNNQSLPTGMFKVAQHVSICKYYSFRNPNRMDSDEDILLLEGIKHIDKKVEKVMGKNNVERKTKVKNNAKDIEKAKKRDRGKKNKEQTKKHIKTRKNPGKDKHAKEAVLKKPAASVAGGFAEKVTKRARRAPSPELLESTD